MIKVIILGAGNVAIHLAKAFQKTKSVEVIQRYNKSTRNSSEFDPSIPFTKDLQELVKADVYIISITDDAIAGFSKRLKFKHGIVVHTSGSIPLEALQCKAAKGVFYPLQTFSKEKKVDFIEVPVCVESELNKNMIILEDLAKAVSRKVYRINSLQREKLHVAAVFASNFSNHMYKIAGDICESNKISFDILKPLILETAKKIQTIEPVIAQTGPARRDDRQTIQKHLSELEGIQKEIYTLVTQSITETYSDGKKL